MFTNKHSFLASRVAEPVTVSNSDMNELLFNDKAKETWEPCWGRLTKHFFESFQIYYALGSLILKVNNGIVKRSVISGQGRTGFQIHFVLHIFSQFKISQSFVKII